jgi:hypothetical protein
MVINARGGFERGQHRFHRHHWRRRPAVSVVMSRPDARTVSRTAIDVGGRTMALRYESLDEPAPLMERRIACDE